VTDDLPTPRSISRSGYRVHVWRKACRHAKDADLAALLAADHGDVPLVQLKAALRQLRLSTDGMHRGRRHMRPGSR
jgi:hypothetical protein